MLSQATRANFSTLLDALSLSHTDDSPAIIYVETDSDTQMISRADFRSAVERYAANLRRLGIGDRDLVVIAHTQNLESIYAFWGALLISAIPSMFPTLTEKLDPDIYMASLAELVKRSGVSAVLTTDSFATELTPHVDCPVYGPAHLRAAIDADEVAPVAPDPDAIAFLQHSSGTTGLQKGVALSHRAVLNQLASYSDALAFNQQDVIVSWLPLYHDMGLIAGFLLPLIQGRPLVLMSPFDWVKHPVLLFRAISDHAGTLCWLPNFAYNHMARRIRDRDLDGVSLRSMRMFINCSEPVRHDSHTLFLDRFGELGIAADKLAVSYAMAENTFAVTQTPPAQTPNLDYVDRTALEQSRRAEPSDDQSAVTMVSCGRPIAGTEVRIINADGENLPERHVGEVVVRSDCMLTEYYRRPDLNPFADGWYRTGDMGYSADGEIYIVGRQKDLIINAGKNIYPQDIEAIVNDVPGVHAGRAVVFGVPDEREGTELIAVVAEVKTNDPAEHKRIKQAVRQVVGGRTEVTVSFVTLVDERWLIKTSSGKIARAANRDKWLAERENQS